MSESEKFVRSFNHVRRLRTSTNNKTHATVAAAAAAAAAHCSLHAASCTGSVRARFYTLIDTQVKFLYGLRGACAVAPIAATLRPDPQPSWYMLPHLRGCSRFTNFFLLGLGNIYR